ncbi:tyrosine-type recombinase/integrase [Apibacter sp. HY039]|uniref:tyrosine-type recombinase/integrase n=1 Tax=Apibacter sp. HY039 TaxID=2501476 RepID=UPI000FEB8709|nr:tyrosine-type recombinase/integrase [Apibacter sp. HY039]
MQDDRLQNYKKYLELKGYQKSSIRGLLKRAEFYEDKTSGLSLSLKPSTLQQYYYQKKVYVRYLQDVEKEVYYLPEEHHKKETTTIDILTLEEVEELIKNCKDLREQVVLVCLYSLGLRISEVSNIELQDIDPKEKLLLIRKSKTKKQRQVPISKSSLTLLQNYIEKERPDTGVKLLQGLQGDLSTDGVYQIVKRLIKRTHINKRIYPHLLRHSIASHLLTRGMEVEQISKFLGHTSLESTQRYTHLEVSSNNQENERI